MARKWGRLFFPGGRQSETPLVFLVVGDVQPHGAGGAKELAEVVGRFREDGDILPGQAQVDGVSERADVEDVFGIELEIGPEVVEQVALAAEQHVDLADIGMFRGPRHRRPSPVPASPPRNPPTVRCRFRPGPRPLSQSTPAACPPHPAAAPLPP